MSEKVVKTEENTKGNMKKNIKTFLMFAIPTLVLFVGIWTAGGIQASNHALNHANLSRNEVNFIRFSLDLDDFIPTYEVSWYENAREVEYTVHAVTGQLIGWDYD